MASDISGSDHNSGGLPEHVTQAYYRYGLFVATHPYKIILFATAIFLTFSSPLYYLPLPGYLPQEYTTGIHNYSVPPRASDGGMSLSPSSIPTPLWYQGPPAVYIQQIIVRSGVGPVTFGSVHPELSVSDSYRGPLATVFDLYQRVTDFQTKLPSGDTFLTDQCLLVDDVVKKHRKEGGAEGLLPHFNCLLLSPADLWTRDKNEFLKDPHVLSTIKSLMAKTQGMSKVADILFGVPSAEIGLTKYSHPKVITYSITLALKQYQEGFVKSFRSDFLKKYPLHTDSRPTIDEMIHVYFPTRLSLWEILICLFYSFLFGSIYLSLGRIKMLSSRIGITIAVLVTMISSLCLAVGVCAFFGLKPLHSQGKYVYPILAGLVGFENSMLLIRCIASIPQHLDVKIRVARGLASEGWVTTKYFLIMITIVTISFFFFIPIVQEICIYGSLVLLCDLYMQLVFLTAVVSIDLQRAQESKQSIKREVLSLSSFSSRKAPNRILNSEVNSSTRTGIPNLHRRNAHYKFMDGQDILAPRSSPPTTKPSCLAFKRLRLTYFITSRRMLHRIIVCVFVGWFAWTFYTTTGLHDHLEVSNYDGPGLASLIHSIKAKSSEQSISNKLKQENPDNHVKLNSEFYPLNVKKSEPDYSDSSPIGKELDLKVDKGQYKGKYHQSLPNNHQLNSSQRLSDDEAFYDGWYQSLKHSYPDLSDFLPDTHWPTLFGYYNISLKGEYITLLPPILLSIPVSVEDALAVHNAADPNYQPWHPPEDPDSVDSKEFDGWLHGLKSGSESSKTTSRIARSGRRTPFIPSSSGEMIVTGIMAIPAVLVIVYATVWLYRCVCSRHYAEWREQWWAGEQAEARAQIIGECVPAPLYGHASEVECLCSDGAVVASACLSGNIRVWDPFTSECLVNIDRSRVRRLVADVKGEDRSSDYESGSPKSQPDFFSSQLPGNIWQTNPNDNDFEKPFSSDTAMLPDFSSSIKTNFGSIFASPAEKKTGNFVFEAPQPFNGLSFGAHMKRNSSSDSLVKRKYSAENLAFEDKCKQKAENLAFEDKCKQKAENLAFEDKCKQKAENLAFEDKCKQNLAFEDKCSQKPHPRNLRSSQSHRYMPSSPPLFGNGRHSHKRNLSAGSAPTYAGKIPQSINYQYHQTRTNSRTNYQEDTEEGSSVWALQCQDGLVFAGCSDGTIEVWDGYSGGLKFVTSEGEGITAISVSGSKLVATRLSGFLEIYSIKVDDTSMSDQRQKDDSMHRKQNSELLACDPPDTMVDNYIVHLTCDVSKKVHHQPVSVLCCDENLILTGSQDHSLKLFHLKDGRNIFTLHGHMGPITTAIIGGPVGGAQQEGDTVVLMASTGEGNLEGAIIASGAQDGSLCVWDIVTGACVYSVTGHSAAVLSIVISSSYLISLAADDKLAVWERFQGHLLNTLHITHMFCSSIIMLTSKLLVTTKQGRLCVWDVSTGSEVLEVSLGDSESSIFPRHLLAVGANIICDYGNTLRSVRMPVAEKMD